MPGKESLTGTEQYREIKDTVLLPETKGEYMHISTTPAKLARTFGEYAAQLGYNEEEAQTFFEENVEVKFGRVYDVALADNTKLEIAISRLVPFSWGAKLAGTVVPKEDGKYIFCLDIQGIAENLPKLRSFQVGDYFHMTTEQKIASFEQAVQSLAEHELFHTTQYMTDPETMKEAASKVKLSNKIFLTWMAAAGTIGTTLPPEISTPIIISTGLATVGTAVHLSEGMVEIEKDAYTAQKKASKLHLRNPFKFSHETTNI